MFRTSVVSESGIATCAMLSSYARREGDDVLLTHLFLTMGERFFTRFLQFQGKVLNKKL